MSTLIWLHEDALRRDHPVFAKAGEAAQPVFIWDEAYLQQMDYGFKRLMFIYETLMDMQCPVYKGDMVTIWEALLEHYQAGAIMTAYTPNPLLQQRQQQCAVRYSFSVIRDEPFVVLEKKPDLQRFFRYWKKAEKTAMQPDAGLSKNIKLL